MTQSPPPLIFVTGLSGAGMSSALKILEDVGYEVFDNFPLGLIPALLEQGAHDRRPIAIGIDSRTRQFDPMRLLATIEDLKEKSGFQVKTIFMLADDAVLLKRFTETRRTHPMARDRSVADGIAAEKALLFPLKHQSGYVIDTSELSIHDLRRVVEGFAGGLQKGKFNITLMSFAYRHGLPREADLVFDVRFLRNPNWVPELKEKTGLTKEVQDYVQEDDAYAPFMAGVETMMDLLLPRYREEGKSYLTIAFGCTGGRHRSVTAAENLFVWLKKRDYPVTLHHREIKGEKP
jgi:UPF0042 nucleotide-binding protein